MAFEEDPPLSAPEWIVTFSDMVSLLVTFFVLLMTFATMEAQDKMSGNQKLNARQGLFQRKSGEAIADEVRKPRMDEVSSSRGAPVPHSRPERELMESLENMGQRQRSTDIAFDLSRLGHGIVLTFGQECSFDPGSSDVSIALVRKLGELGRALEHYPVEVHVEGHTDGRFKPTIAHPTASALAFERARRAVDVLLRDCDLKPEQLRISGIGDTEPRCGEESVQGRTCNRRIELRIYWMGKESAR